VTAFQALVLAGSRGGVEPVAAYAGVTHKALIELQGQTLLARVVGALQAAGAARIAVISSHPDVRAEIERLGVEALDEAAGSSMCFSRPKACGAGISASSTNSLTAA
jgi:GTP:adenosylcobinamide-phosphate guanylyltransferase